MDFGQRINDARNQSNSSMNTYNQYQREANQAGDRFNTAFDDRRGYGDIYSDARSQYFDTDEINAARGTYQQARDAMDQMNTTINKLPESIRQQFGGTGMTEAQRARAMGDQYAQNANTHNYLSTNYSNAAADYNDLANRAMQEVQHVATGMYGSQEDALNTLQSAYATLLGQRNTAYGENQTDRGLLASVYEARDADRLARDELAFKRWAVEQENARAAADRAMDSYIAQLSVPTIPEPQDPGANYTAPRTPQNNVYRGNRNVVDDGGIGGLIKQGWQNVKDYGPLALFGGGSLWR